MQIDTVMDQLGEALGTIEGLRVFPYWADKVVPPAAIVGFPDSITFDETMRRGGDRAEFPVIVVVARRDGRSSRGRMAGYVAGSGASSVKAAIEGHAPSGYHSARVSRAELGVASIAGVEHLSATFSVDIIGTGA